MQKKRKHLFICFGTALLVLIIIAATTTKINKIDMSKSLVSTNIVDSLEVSNEQMKDSFQRLKGQYVKWTGYVNAIYTSKSDDDLNSNESRIIFGSKDGQNISARFEYIIKSKDFPEGSIVTITGIVEDNPSQNSWYLENCLVDKTTDEDRNSLADYCSKLKSMPKLEVKN